MKLDYSLIYGGAIAGAVVIALVALLKGDLGLAGNVVTGLFALIVIPRGTPS